METIEKTEFVCRFCEKKFSSSQRLKSHLTKRKPCHESLIKDCSNNEVVIFQNNNIVVEEEELCDFSDSNEVLNFKIPAFEKTIKDEKSCPYCKKTLINKYVANHHIITCNQYHRYINEVKQKMTTQIIDSVKFIKQYQKQIKQLTRENKKLSQQVQEDNRRKTDIIAEQTKVQEKTIDMLAYLQKNHQDTPRLELPKDFQLTEDEMERLSFGKAYAFDEHYMKIGFPDASIQILKRLFLTDRALNEIPIWCLDESREKFAIKNSTWETEIGGTQLIKTIEPVNDQFNRYVINQYPKYSSEDKLSEFNELQLKMLKAYDAKTKRNLIRTSCQEFNIKKLFACR
jgi:cell division protein FtsB